MALRSEFAFLERFVVFYMPSILTLKRYRWEYLLLQLTVFQSYRSPVMKEFPGTPKVCLTFFATFGRLARFSPVAKI